MTPDQARVQQVDRIVTEILEEMSVKGNTLWYRREELERIVETALRAARGEVLQELLSVVEDEEEAGVKSLSTGFLKVILERRKAAALDAGKEG